MPNQLDRTKLAELREEEIIAQEGRKEAIAGAAGFRKFGEALERIRVKKLYCHETNRKTGELFGKDWDGYLQQNWQMTRMQALRLRKAAKIAEECNQIGYTVKNESQARELGKAPDSQRGQVIAEAKEAAGPRFTTEDIRRARQQAGLLDGLSPDEKKKKAEASEAEIIATAPPRARGETDHSEEIGKIAEHLEKALKRAEKNDYRKLAKAIQRAMDIAGETLAEVCR